MNKRIFAILLSSFLLTLSACATTNEPPVVNEPSTTKEATLYIGTKADGFTDYPLNYEGDLTPEKLIQGIADYTGWDMTLAEAITSGKGGFSICFANSSTLFVGPPDPQKDEFHMFDGIQLAQALLDSTQKTLQMNFTGKDGNPDALDIYYYMEGNQPLQLPTIDKSWPLDQPYQWVADSE